MIYNITQLDHSNQSKCGNQQVVDTLTESGAVFKVVQNTFDIMWRRLPDALRLFRSKS